MSQESVEGEQRLRKDPLRVQVANQQLLNWCDRRRLLLIITASAAVSAPLLLLLSTETLHSSTLSVTEMQQPQCLSMKQLGARSAERGSWCCCRAVHKTAAAQPAQTMGSDEQGGGGRRGCACIQGAGGAGGEGVLEAQSDIGHL